MMRDMADPTFIDLMERSREGARATLKVYIGSAAGVGKTYRMLQEGIAMRNRGIDVVVGLVETHGRAETLAQIGDLEIVPRAKVTYRGITLEEMDVDAILARKPMVALVDELAHTNVPGSRHEKRWQDVMDLLAAGISVVTTVNVQHLESLNDVVASAVGVVVRETVPDWVVIDADQVVNVDISIEDLRQRLQDGKIYAPAKVEQALANFFTEENLTTLRELALREVASNVDRQRELFVRRDDPTSGSGGGGATRKTVDRIMVAMSSNPPHTALLLRKASRIAGRLNSDWYCVYVQRPEEAPDRIDATVQRKLVDNIQRAQSMGAEVVMLKGDDVAAALRDFAIEHGVTLAVLGQSRRGWWHRVVRGSVADQLASGAGGLDVLVVSFGGDARG